MLTQRSPLHDLRVASPCSAAWEKMEGDDCVRYCEDCALHVYNLSAMTAQEAERLVVQKEGRLCVRFYQREDGTVMTQDCPRGIIALRRAAQRTSVAFIGAIAAMCLLVLGLLAGLIGWRVAASNMQFFQGGSSINGQPPLPVMGEACPVEKQQPQDAPKQ